MTQIELLLADQLLAVVQQPTVASGDQNSVQIQVEFDSHWKDYTKSAVFLTASDPTVYEVDLTDNLCIIPWEVLATDGTLYIGIRGVNTDHNKVKTSTLISYKIVKGAPGGTGTTVDPTTDAYAKIIARLEALEKGGNSGGNDSGQNLTLDTTLTQSGKAADAKVVGDEIKRVEGLIPSIEGLAKSEEIPTKPEQVGADPKGTAASAVSAHNTNNAAHNDIRLLIEGLTTRLNALANSTDTDLDQMAELVAYIKSNKSLIDGITTSKVSVADIVNNLTTNVANKPLSAAQGVAIKALIDSLSASLANYQPKGDYALTSAVPTKVSQLIDDKGYLTEHQDISHLTPTVKAVTKAEYSVLTPDAVAQLYADGIRMLIVEDGYTNLVPKSTDAAGNVYRGCGYLNGYRLTSSGVLAVSENCCVSGFMPYTHGSTIRIVGSCGDVLTNGGQYVGVYDASYGVIQIDYPSTLVNSGAATWEPRADGLWELVIDTSKVTAWKNAKYFRVSCLMCVGADMVVTVNEPIGLEV